MEQPHHNYNKLRKRNVLKKKIERTYLTYHTEQFGAHHLYVHKEI